MRIPPLFPIHSLTACAHRTLILDELVRLLPGQVDSFGKCHQNANIHETLDELGVADQVGAKTNWNEKVRALALLPAQSVTD